MPGSTKSASWTADSTRGSPKADPPPLFLLGLKAKNYDDGFYGWSWHEENEIALGSGPTLLTDR